MDTQLDALPILPVLARGVSGCVNSAFSQQISTFYEPSVQAMDTQLGARHRWRTPTIHRGSAERRIGVRPTGGLQVTRQRSETGRPAVADDERVWRATARGYYGPSSPAAAETPGLIDSDARRSQDKAFELRAGPGIYQALPFSGQDAFSRPLERPARPCCPQPLLAHSSPMSARSSTGCSSTTRSSDSSPGPWHAS